MANKQIHNYTAATTIDASADLLLIDPASSGVYKSINRNTLLALASQPLGLTDSQSPQNKVLDNTNSLTVKDGSLTIQNTSSTTKQAVFSASGITAGQTRTFTFPDASGTLVTTGGTQTLTAKTITSPVITGGTYDNGTITVDSIGGHTLATTVTVANLQIANGVLNTANSVTATAIAASAVQPQALLSGTGSGWGWQSFAPSWTNLTPGNGTTVAKYMQTGKTVSFRLFFTLGSTSAVGGSITFTLPVTANSDYAATAEGATIGNVKFLQPSVAAFNGAVIIASGDATKAQMYAFNASGTYLSPTNTSSTVPFTFGLNNIIMVTGQYEAA